MVGINFGGKSELSLGHVGFKMLSRQIGYECQELGRQLWEALEGKVKSKCILPRDFL